MTESCERSAGKSHHLETSSPHIKGRLYTNLEVCNRFILCSIVMHVHVTALFSCDADGISTCWQMFPYYLETHYYSKTSKGIIH